MAALLGLCLLVGFAAGDVMDVSVRAWYLSLARPPGVLAVRSFGAVWEALYLPMAVATWLVWRHPDGRRKRAALSIWGWQLALNVFWTPLFFGLHLMLGALAVSAALIACIVWTLFRFRPLDGRAAALLLPCLGWAGYAAYLNAGFCWLNQ